MPFIWHKCEMIMQETEVKDLIAELGQILGTDTTDASVKEAIDKVVSHRPLQAYDDIVAENVGLPLGAVTIIRTLLRNLALAEAESEKKSRLSVHNPGLRLPVIPIPNCINQTKKTFTQTYRSWYIKRVPLKGKSNEA